MTSAAEFRARVRDVFGETLERPEAMREAYLDEACRGDEALQLEVRSLLHALTSAGDYLAEPTIDTMPGERPNDVLGRYRLIELVGEGGFGAVYRAEQREPVRREVALKIIKLGMDTRQVVACFEVERQTLAAMDHPGIARMIDAGATPTGRPYVVMEFVRGEPITTFCDSHRLSIDERLELFVQVCLAVQHAHQKGVAHCDLKPSNALVSMVDGKPSAKVIDFGIARIVAGDGNPRTRTADAFAFLGTPEYMSPEQLGSGGNIRADVDTRTDIYSLGVILYQLLTGTLPLESGPGQRGSHSEFCWHMYEAEPRRPSTRLRLMGAARADAVARARGDASRSLIRRLRHDLDWIALKAMAKDRASRYASASELAHDIRRHLSGQPVLARPPSAGYVAGKFVRRHKGPVVAAAIVLTLLLAAVMSTTWALREARQQRDAAEWRAYAAGLSAAAAAIDASDFLAAVAHLESVPTRLRGWEWRHLMTRTDLAYRSFRAHDGAVHSLAISGDGKLLATGSDRSLCVWGTMTASLVREMPTDGRVKAVALDFAGQRVLSHEVVADGANSRSEVAMRDVANGARLWHIRNASCVQDSFSADGATVAVLLDSSRSLAWIDAATGAVLAQQYIDGGSVAAMAMATGGEILYATWNGEKLGEAGILSRDGSRTLGDSNSIYLRPVFCVDAQTIVWDGWTDGRVFAGSLRTNTLSVLAARPGFDRTPLDASADASLVAIAEGPTVLLWNTADSHARTTLPGHRAPLTAASFSRDASILATADETGEVRIWRLPQPDAPCMVPAWENWDQFCASVSADGSRAVTGGWSFVRLWDTRAGWHRLVLNAGSRHVESVALSPDGQRVAACGRDRPLFIFNAESGDALVDTTLKGTAPLLWASDGREILRLHAGAIDLLDAADGSVRHTLRSPAGPIRHMALANAGLVTLAWPNGGAPGVDEDSACSASLVVWDVPSRRMLSERSLSNLRPTHLAIDPTGHHLATVSEDGAVSVWCLDNGSCMWRLPRVNAAAEALAFSRDGTRLAIARADRIDFADVPTGQVCVSLRHGVGTVLSISFADDDASLIVFGEHHPIAVFDGAPPAPATTLGRSRLLRARQICDPLFQRFIASHQVAEHLRGDGQLDGDERAAAIDYATDRGDHLAGLASEAVFCIRRRNFVGALVRYEAIQRHNTESAPTWDRTVALVQYRIGALDEAFAAARRSLAWTGRDGGRQPGTLAILALVEFRRGRHAEAAEAWREASNCAADAGTPSDEFFGPLWTEAMTVFGDEHRAP